MEILHSEKVQQLSNIKALLFDWDGVFHNGTKNALGESLFSEIDSMGVNMLRLGYFLKSRCQKIPKTYIITGEINPTSKYLATREHFDGVFSKFKDKKAILSYLEDHHNIVKEEVLFVFDDILDVSLAEQCGIRFNIKHEASHLFHQFIKERGVVDFVASCSAGNNAVREISEFVLLSMDMLNEAFEQRIAFSDKYRLYWEARQTIVTQFYEMTPDFTLKQIN